MPPQQRDGKLALFDARLGMTERETERAREYLTEDWDTDGYHDNATNNSRLTAPIAGRYRVNASGFFAGAASGICLLSFKVNGAGGGWVNISTDLNLRRTRHLREPWEAMWNTWGGWMR